MHRLQHGHVVYNKVFSKFINFYGVFLSRASLRRTSPFCVLSLPLLTFLDLSSFKKFQKTLFCMQTSLVTKKTLLLCFSSYYSECRLSLLILLLLLLLSLSSFNSAFIFSRLRRRKEECSSSSTTHNTYI